MQEERDEEWAQTYRDLGYAFCRPHQEWHRPPECAINQNGETVPWWEAS
jgi:hypothetical protein